MRILPGAAVLAVLWLLLSGFFTPLQLTFGLLSCALATWLTARMGLLDGACLRLAPRLPGYGLWLTWEIVKSNLHVARVILSPRMPLRRQMLTLVPTQRSDLGVAIYANSITLTPGTLTTDADGDCLRVHALTDAVAADLAGGAMDRRVRTLERLS